MSQDRRFVSKLTLPLWLVASSVAFAAGRPIDIAERSRGADKVVVATAANVSAQWRTNAYGDRIIVSQVALVVEETLKGAAEASVMLDLEGGSLDGVTLHVSDLPELKGGDRAVFFLKRSGASTHVPHLRGLGILKLNGDSVPNSSLRLESIRQMVASDGK